MIMAAKWSDDNRRYSYSKINSSHSHKFTIIIQRDNAMHTLFPNTLSLALLGFWARKPEEEMFNDKSKSSSLILLIDCFWSYRALYRWILLERSSSRSRYALILLSFSQTPRGTQNSGIEREHYNLSHYPTSKYHFHCHIKTWKLT